MANGFKITHHYDKEADVLYVSFGDDEPAYTDNKDDVLLIEIGWFSGEPKGFRIIGLRQHNITAVVDMAVVIKNIKSQVHVLMENKRKAIKEQEPVFTDFCNTLPKIFAGVK